MKGWKRKDIYTEFLTFQLFNFRKRRRTLYSREECVNGAVELKSKYSSRVISIWPDSLSKNSNSFPWKRYASAQLRLRKSGTALIRVSRLPWISSELFVAPAQPFLPSFSSCNRCYRDFLRTRKKGTNVQIFSWRFFNELFRIYFQPLLIIEKHHSFPFSSLSVTIWKFFLRN